MPTPIGHALAGYAAAKLTRVQLARDERRLFLCAALFGILPDVLALLLGPVGEPNHGFSHSLAGLVLVSLPVAALAWRRGFRFWPVLLFLAAAYGSHLFADMLRPAPTAESGEQLLWPLRTAYALNVDIFPHVPRFDQFGSHLQWAAVVLAILLREVVILGPLAVLARFLPPVWSARPAARAATARADPAEAA